MEIKQAGTIGGEMVRKMIEEINKSNFDHKHELSCLLSDRQKEYEIWNKQNNWVAENIAQSIDLEMSLIRKLIDTLVTKNDLENILEYCQNDLYDIVEEMLEEGIYKD